MISVRSFGRAIALAVMSSLAGAAMAASTIDPSVEPKGVLPPKTLQKLWDAYKTAKECFAHPTYAKGTPLKLGVLTEKQFRATEWKSPFTAFHGTKSCTTDAGSLQIPKPIAKVTLDERYGERQEDVDRVAVWFRRLTTYHHLTGDPIAATQLRQALLDWAKAKGLTKGIHVSWGAKPVDYQMMTAIMSMLSAAAEIAPSLSEDDRALIGPWLNDLVKQSAASYWKDRTDNKAYMRAYMALLWGITVGDDKAVQDAILTFKLGINDMRPDGSQPIDSQRGGMGINYNAASSSHLVMIAVALKSALGIDLFDYSVDGRSVHSAVDFIVRSLKEPAATNLLYAIPCPGGGDRWGALDKPNTHHHEEVAGALVAYANLFPERESSKYIRAEYAHAEIPDSEKNGGIAACLYATAGGDVTRPALEMPTPPPELPKPTFVVAAREEMAHRTGLSSEVNSLMVAEIAKAPKGEGRLKFNVVGTFGYTKGDENFREMRFILADSLKKEAVEAVKACGVEFEVWDDGNHVVLKLDKVGNNFVARNTDCLMKALPKELAYQAAFLFKNFRDIAIGMVATGDVDSIQHQGLRTFVNRVAIGEISVGS